MDKLSKIVKTIPATGTKAVRTTEEIPRKVLMKIEDGETGRTKCAAFVEIADTPALCRRGLSKRASIGPRDGMWFDCHGPFWMKDTEFPLDLCYLDRNGTVTEKVAMAKDKLGRTTYPRKNASSEQAVEFPAGFCRRHGIEVGDRLVPLSEVVRSKS